MYTIQGKGVSGGVANGPLCFYRRGDHDIAKHEIADAEAEKQRFESARQTAMEQLKALYEKAVAEVGEEGAELFEAHQMMLDDLDYVEGIQDLIDGEPFRRWQSSLRRCLPQWMTATCRRAPQTSRIFPTASLVF